MDIYSRKNFEVLRSATALNKANLEGADTVKDKHTVNDSVFITYSNTINFYGKWLNNSGYLIYQWQNFVKEQAISWFKNWEDPKK